MMPCKLIVVDLDGTLCKTDTLHESLCMLARESPLSLFSLPLWLFRGRAHFKMQVAERVELAVELLPYNDDLISYLREQRSLGKKIWLATAADTNLAEAVAKHLDLFDMVIASDGITNLKGRRKLDAIRARTDESFCYAGDSVVDIPVWEACRQAITVNVSPSLRERVVSLTDFHLGFEDRPISWATWTRAFRVHQWLKNLLVFVPLLSSFSYTTASSVILALLSFVSFSFVASATYVVNDLLDLKSDRRHPNKRFRPFASGELPISKGLVVAGILLMAGMILGGWISLQYFSLLSIYFILTLLYSSVLKKYVLLDSIVLSVLYTIRIVAGAVAIGVVVSNWLLAFSVLLFLSLALMKRCSELKLIEKTGGAVASGRDYRLIDSYIIVPMGVSSAVGAIVVFGMYLSMPETLEQYSSVDILWLLQVLLIYWIGRLWIKTNRGEMDDDPIVYTLHDKGGAVIILGMVLLVVAAHMV